MAHTTNLAYVLKFGYHIMHDIWYLLYKFVALQDFEDVCKKKTSQMHENDQATIKTRYCGHLYSPLLRKWTCWGQTGWVSYCMERGLKGNLMGHIPLRGMVSVGCT